MKLNYDSLWHMIFGHDCGDRLQCLSLEAPFLREENFTAEIWREASANIPNTEQREATYNALSDSEISKGLYDYYLETRPQFNNAYIAVGDAGPIWVVSELDDGEEQHWFGWPVPKADGSFEKVEILRCTDKVLQEVVRRGPSADDSIVRVSDSPFDSYYHIDELRPTHSYLKFQR
jgi:hypothetical protein